MAHGSIKEPQGLPMLILTTQGNALSLVDGIKVGYCRERQTNACLVAKTWILVYSAHIQGLTTMKCPSMFSQAKPQLMNPS
uniref:Uncharacterized protein n=1 Tax=Leersia perrieri TaxID=77586 RepID=A0A0D9XJQ4_9ORYZ